MVAGESNFSQKICTIYSSSIHTEEIARSYINTIMICLYTSRIYNPLSYTYQIIKIIFVVQGTEQQKNVRLWMLLDFTCCNFDKKEKVIRFFSSSTLLMLKHSTHVITLKLEDPLNEIKVFKGCPLLAYVWCCKIITPVITLFIAPANSLVFSI